MMQNIDTVLALALAILLSQSSGTDRAASPAERDAVPLRKAAADGGQGRSGKSVSGDGARSAARSGNESTDAAAVCLARTLYWETKGEGAAAMGAVASVVMNRVRNEGFPDTVCGVVQQGREQGPCQFSWWCDGRPDEVEEMRQYRLARRVARKALSGQLADRTGGATYYHRKGLSPDWSKTYVKTAEVGSHVFYKPPAGGK